MKNNIRDAIFKYAVLDICRILYPTWSISRRMLCIWRTNLPLGKCLLRRVFFFLLLLLFLILDGDSKNLHFIQFFFRKKRMRSWLVGRWDISQKPRVIRAWPCLCHSQVTVVCLYVLKKSRCAVNSASARDTERFLVQGLRYLAVVCQAANAEMSPIFSFVVCLILKSTRGGIKGLQYFGNFN